MTLRSDVLDIFEEAQRMTPESRVRMRAADTIEFKRDADRHRRRKERAREAGRRNIARAITRPTETLAVLVLPVTCPRCGGVAELRLGCERPYHRECRGAA